MRALVLLVVCALAVTVSASHYCSPFGAYRCDPNGPNIQVCNYNAYHKLVWQDLQCQEGTSCSNVGTSFVCAEDPSEFECELDARQCVSSTEYQVCIASNGGTEWGPTTECPDEEECSNGTCAPASETCEPNGAMQCTNSTRFRQCSNGAWYEQSCAPGTECEPYQEGTIICS